MKIEQISGHMVLDEFPDQGNDNTYLLSRPMSLKALKHSPFLLIYTTAYIKNIITMDLDDPLVEGCIHPISTTSANWSYVKIPNEDDVKLRVLPTESATQNVMFLFENENNNSGTILYTGYFTEYESVVYNNRHFERAAGKIDHLYIDKTLDDMNYLETTNSIQKTCATMEKLSARFPQYKMHLMLTGFGYEDLLVALSKIYVKEIHLDQTRANILRNFGTLFADSEDTAKMIVKDLPPKSETPLADVKRQFEENKIIHVKFTDMDRMWPSRLGNIVENVYEGLGLVQYSPHPSPIEIYDFTEWAKAKNVHPITSKSIVLESD